PSLANFRVSVLMYSPRPPLGWIKYSAGPGSDRSGVDKNPATPCCLVLNSLSIILMGRSSKFEFAACNLTRSIESGKERRRLFRQIGSAGARQGIAKKGGLTLEP